jgi:hypothetical protein
MGGLIDDDDLFELSVSEGWNLIITRPDLNDKAWPITFDKFVKLDENSYPNLSEYYGTNIEVWVRNNE